jgi:hypothetical protein
MMRSIWQSPLLWTLIITAICVAIAFGVAQLIPEGGVQQCLP